MTTFRVLDRKKNVLWTGNDHVAARRAFKALNMSSPEPRAYTIVDERDRIFGSLRGDSAGALMGGMCVPLALHLAPEVIDRLRGLAHGSVTKMRDVVREAIGADLRPLGGVAIDSSHEPFHFRVTVAMRDVLEHRAAARGVTVEQCVAESVMGWVDGIDRAVA